MDRFPNEYNEICVPAGAREEFLEKEVADLKEELSRKTEMLYAMEAELRKVSEGQMEWISVEERLPGAYGRYISYNGKDIIISYSDPVRPGLWSNEKITHWMPLPEPPKPKEPTFKDVFLKAFPKAQKYDEGTPIACAEDVFPQVKRHDHCDGRCDKCWNLPYFEPEGEGGE